MRSGSKCLRNLATINSRDWLIYYRTQWHSAALDRHQDHGKLIRRGEWTDIGLLVNTKPSPLHRERPPGALHISWRRGNAILQLGCSKVTDSPCYCKCLLCISIVHPLFVSEFDENFMISCHFSISGPRWSGDGHHQLGMPVNRSLNIKIQQYHVVFWGT